jgi:TetR/AcrR family transcriptional regulator, lmrAB and yxaGH operons repressor
MPAALMTREEVLAILLETFRRDGYDGASLAALSKATRLGKSSLYHYFPGGKADMINQVLDLVDAWVESQLLEPLRGTGTPAVRLERMLDTLSGFYEQGAKACILGRLCASVDRPRFQPRLEHMFARLIAALTELIVETGIPRKAARQRAEDAVIRIQGALILSQGVADTAPFRRTMRSLQSQLLAPGED